MKFPIDTKKGADAVSGFLQKTSDLSKKTLSDVQAGAVAFSEKAKQDNYLRRLKKYNPLFPDVYTSDTFNIPNMIMIRDDAERRGIDVCEGAIGWLGNAGNIEVLYLYDEAIPFSGITFVPSADCNAIYYVDKFDRKRFIRTDCIFKIAHDERLAELEHVAYSLGAKHCTIDIVEKEKSLNKSNRKFDFNKNANLKSDKSSSHYSSNDTIHFDTNHEVTYNREDKRCSELTWEGSDKPKRPKLKWFAHDDGVKGLIEMRCKGGNSVKSKSLEISGSTSATMSKDTACRIDRALSIMGDAEGTARNKKHIELDKQATRETERTFIFHIEF